MTVELLYDLDCPNVAKARAALLEAFTKAGIRPSWKEWNRNDPNAPSHARRFGSPTILVNGMDVAGMEPSDQTQDCCRLYRNFEDTYDRTPSVSQIAEALNRNLSAGM